jgi:hypothetical protein
MLSSGVCPQRHPGWVHGVASSTQPGLAARCDRAAEGYYAPHRGRRMAADGDQWQQAGSALGYRSPAKFEQEHARRMVNLAA